MVRINLDDLSHPIFSGYNFLSDIRTYIFLIPSPILLLDGGVRSLSWIVALLLLYKCLFSVHWFSHESSRHGCHTAFRCAIAFTVSSHKLQCLQISQLSDFHRALFLVSGTPSPSIKFYPPQETFGRYSEKNFGKSLHSIDPGISNVSKWYKGTNWSVSSVKVKVRNWGHIVDYISLFYVTHLSSQTYY